MAPEDILDRMALQCSILENRGEDEITLTTHLKRDLLLDEGDLEILAEQLGHEFEVEFDTDDTDTWRFMKDVVKSVCERIGATPEEASSYAEEAPKKKEDDVFASRRRRRSHPESE